jgi:plastocyanin
MEPNSQLLADELSGTKLRWCLGKGDSLMRRASLQTIVVLVFATVLLLWMTLSAQEKSVRSPEHSGKKRATRVAKTVTVEMKDFAFVPETVEINVGDTVTWVNRDTAEHTATRNDPPAFNTGLLAQGESGSITFTAPSDMKGFEYFCIPHQSFMRGHVRVMLPGSAPMRTTHAKAVKRTGK